MNEPLRILNLFTVMNRGGAETMVMNYYRNIDRSRVQFDFIEHRPSAAYDDEIISLGGHIYRLPQMSLSNLNVYKKSISEFFNQHQEYKILHAHMSEGALFIFREASKRNVPVRICHAHNAPSFCNENLIEKIKHPIRDIFKCRIRPYTTHRFACSNDAGKWLFGKNAKFTIMNNAVDSLALKFNADTRLQMRRDLNLGDKFVIGHVGRFNQQKNHEFLIDIFADIHEKNVNTVLLLVGDGILRKQIEEKVKRMNLSDCVIFLGIRNDIANLLNCMDLFLFPSNFEGLSVALIEAQANGLQCVVSSSMPKDVAITENIEFVSLKKTAHDWADICLRKMQCERCDMSKIIENAGFDIKKNAEWLTDFYLNVLK